MPPAMIGVYDLDVSPLSFDFLHFLTACHAFSEGGHVHVVICPGGRDGWRTKQEVKPIDDAERRWRLDHILIPSALMMGASITLAPDRGLAGAIAGGGENMLPVGWRPDNPRRLYDFSIAVKSTKMGVRPPFRASQKARQFVDQWMDDRKVVTLTLRDTHTPTRNSNTETWLKLAYQLNRRGYRAVIIPDTDKMMQPLPEEYGVLETFPLAACDLDLRMALYERAHLNLSRSGGPFMLCVLGGLPYLWFTLLADEYTPPTSFKAHFTPSAEFMALQGLPPGSQIHENDPNRRIVWKPDSDLDMMVEETLRSLETSEPVRREMSHGYPLVKAGPRTQKIIFQDGLTRPPPPSVSATSPRP